METQRQPLLFKHEPGDHRQRRDQCVHVHRGAVAIDASQQCDGVGALRHGYVAHVERRAR